MSNYSKITDFAAKDALSTGNPAKIVKGTEIDDELVAISGAVASKANTAAPTFTGTTTVADFIASGTTSITGATTVGGALTVSGASSLQAVTATGIVADTLTLDSAIVFEGATEDAYETTITFTDPTADRTLTFPDKTGTVALTTDIDTTSITTASGTYSASGSTTITVSMSSHGRLAGDLVYLNFTSGTAAEGEFTIASIINTNSYTVTHGTSITTSGNVTQYYSTLGQIRLASPAEILAGTNTNKAITPYAYQTTKLGARTAVATTSGTAVDFTDIPSWAKRITVVFSSVSPTTTSPFIVQIGSGTVETSSYAGTCHYLSGSGVANLSMSTGFLLTYNTGTTELTGSYSGALILTNISSNIWVATATLNNSTNQASFLISGTKTLSGALDTVRVTSVSGTNTFDAGLVNILYE